MKRSFFRMVVLSVCIMAVVLVASVPTAQVKAQTNERCFAETGFCISGPIRQFWERNGGLTVFGLPLSAQESEYIGLISSASSDAWMPGVKLQAQRFERYRLELHPDGQVRIGRLGSDTLEQQGRSWWDFEQPGPQQGCHFFEETGHNVCGNILQAWQANGIEADGVPGSNYGESLALFGLPLSEAHMERLEDGNEYLVQWFERARFEYHPGSGAPFDVQFGRLGALDMCLNIPAPIGVDVSPGICLRRGTGYSFQVLPGTFPPGSKFKLWFVSSLGSVLRPDREDEFRMGASGGTSVIGPISVNRQTFGHVEYVIFQGMDNNSFAILYYKVFDPEFWYEQVATFGQSLNPCAGLPIAANADVRTVDAAGNVSGNRLFACAAQGVEAVEFEADGFRPGEAVTLSLITPGGEIISMETLTADDQGHPRNNEGGLPRFFRGSAIATYGPGTYVAYFQGTSIFDDTGAPNIAVIPIKVVDAPGHVPPIVLLYNKSESQSICAVYMTTTDNNSWGGNMLGSNESISPGGARLFEVAAGNYDLMVTDCDGNNYTKKGITLDEGGVYRYTFSGD